MIQAYVDGSYNPNTQQAGFGLVILKDEVILHEQCGYVENEDYKKSKHVAGELMAVGFVIQYCQINKIPAVTICYDYTGIEAWATGKWMTNHDLTLKYQRYVEKCGVKIKWQKVKAHSNDRWNTYADQLAKQGAKGLFKQVQL